MQLVSLSLAFAVLALASVVMSTSIPKEAIPWCTPCDFTDDCKVNLRTEEQAKKLTSPMVGFDLTYQGEHVKVNVNGFAVYHPAMLLHSDEKTHDSVAVLYFHKTKKNDPNFSIESVSAYKIPHNNGCTVQNLPEGYTLGQLNQVKLYHMK